MNPVGTVASLATLASFLTLTACLSLQTSVMQAPGEMTGATDAFRPVVPTTASFFSYGDSITAGVGTSQASERYANLLAGAAPLQNYAESGYTACDMAYGEVFNHPLPTEITSDWTTITMMIGTNDANRNGVGVNESTYNNCHQAAISWLAIPSVNKTFARSPSSATDLPVCTPSAGWQNFGTATSSALLAINPGAQLKCEIETYGGTLYAWYQIANAGAGKFKYSVDGGATTTEISAVKTTPSDHLVGIGVIRLPNLAAGHHELTFTVTSANGQQVVIYGIGTVPEVNTAPYYRRVYVGGVPYERFDHQSLETAAYNADAEANAKLLASDGLPVTFVKVRDFLNFDASFWDSDLHPNAAGNRQLADAFGAALKNFSP